MQMPSCQACAGTPEATWDLFWRYSVSMAFVQKEMEKRRWSLALRGCRCPFSSCTQPEHECCSAWSLQSLLRAAEHCPACLVHSGTHGCSWAQAYANMQGETAHGMRGHEPAWLQQHAALHRPLHGSLLLIAHNALGRAGLIHTLQCLLVHAACSQACRRAWCSTMRRTRSSLLPNWGSPR